MAYLLQDNTSFTSCLFKNFYLPNIPPSSSASFVEQGDLLQWKPCGAPIVFIAGQLFHFN
jgi:hypothetical protein